MVETPYLKLWMSDKIIHVTFAEGLRMDLEIAKLCVAERLKFSEGKSYLCLIDLRGIAIATKEAREYMANEGSRLITAGALMIKSPVARMLGNIFLLINKPKSPARLFTDEQAAVAWLKTFEEKAAA